MTEITALLLCAGAAAILAVVQIINLFTLYRASRRLRDRLGIPEIPE